MSFKKLLINNINYKINIILIDNPKCLSLEDTQYDSFKDFCNNNNFIKLYEYSSKDIINIVKNENDTIINSLDNDEIMNYCYFYLLNKIGGGYLINDDFYLKDNFQKFEFNIYNEKFIYLFNDITQELVNYSNFNDFCKIINIKNNIEIPFFNKNHNIKLNHTKIIIKCQIGTNTSYLKQLLKEYFFINYDLESYYIINNFGLEHDLLTDEKIDYINKKNILVIFLKDELLHYLIDIMKNKPTNIYPLLTNGDDLMKKKYIDYNLFSIYHTLNSNITNLEEDIFQMYYRKCDNFINTGVKNKLYLNLDELLLNYNKFINIISQKSGISIYKKLSDDYKKLPEYKNIINQEYLNELNDITLHSFLNKRNNLIEKKWNNLINFKKEQHEIYFNKDFAVIYYFDNIYNLFQLKLSIYLLRKNFLNNIDIFIYYSENIKEEEIFINHDIRYIKYNKTEIELLNSDFILKYFKNYSNILLLEYDLFLNENISNKINIHFDYYLLDVKEIDGMNNKYEIINKILNKTVFNINNYTNLYVSNTKFLLFNIKFIRSEEFNNFFKILNLLKKSNINMNKTDMMLYFNYLKNKNVMRGSLDVDYFDSKFL